MKLTNLQLQILTDAFMRKVDAKVDEFKKGKEYKSLEKEISTASDVKRLKHIQQETVDIQKQIDDLSKRQRKLTFEGNELLGNYSYRYSNITNDRVERYVADQVAKKINNKFPTRKDVESAIILKSIEKSDNIMQALSDEFKI